MYENTSHKNELAEIESIFNLKIKTWNNISFTH